MNKIKEFILIFTIILAGFAVVLSLPLILEDISYTEKNIGIIKDAEVVPTSFNEQMKVQIKTEDKFFIVTCVGTMPHLTFGDSLKGGFNESKLIYIVDNRGYKFKVK